MCNLNGQYQSYMILKIAIGYYKMYLALLLWYPIYDFRHFVEETLRPSSILVPECYSLLQNTEHRLELIGVSQKSLNTMVTLLSSFSTSDVKSVLKDVRQFCDTKNTMKEPLEKVNRVLSSYFLYVHWFVRFFCFKWNSFDWLFVNVIEKCFVNIFCEWYSMMSIIVEYKHFVLVDNTLNDFRYARGVEGLLLFCMRHFIKSLFSTWLLAYCYLLFVFKYQENSCKKKKRQNATPLQGLIRVLNCTFLIFRLDVWHKKDLYKK